MRTLKEEEVRGNAVSKSRRGTHSALGSSLASRCITPDRQAADSALGYYDTSEEFEQTSEAMTELDGTDAKVVENQMPLRFNEPLRGLGTMQLRRFPQLANVLQSAVSSMK